jgi:tetratricopeptide (TPR) repeat protein
MRSYLFIIISFLYLISGNQIFAQENTIDSLNSLIEKRNEAEHARLYLELARYYFNEKDGFNANTNALKAAELAASYNLKKVEADALSIAGQLNNRRNPELATEYIEKSLRIYRSFNDTVEIIPLLSSLAEIYRKTDPNKSLEIASEMREMAQLTKDTVNVASALTFIGFNNFTKGNYDEALNAWELALEIYTKLNEKSQIGMLYTNIGVIYKSRGNYEKALEYYQENLYLQEEIADTIEIAKALANIGNIYFYVGVDLDKALEYYKRSLELFQKAGNFYLVGNTYNNIGLVYREKSDNGEALVYFKKALKIFKELNYKPGIAASQNYIGNVYLEGGNYTDALNYSKEALKINEEIGNRKEMASNYRDIGKAYAKWGKYDQSLEYFNKSLQLNRELGHIREVFENYKSISEVFEKQGRYAIALDNFKQYNSLKDSSISEEYLKQISELETKYETDRKERELEIQRSQLAEKEAEALAQKAELRRQKLMLLSVIFGLFVVGLFSILLYRQFKEKQKANVLLEDQNIEIKSQRDQILYQKKEITDSIHYASRIQKAILPPSKILESKLADHFILHLPRDIVSGDFYWMTESGSKIIVVAADCTGHGVPGAFMSMLGVSFLNEIVNKNMITSANKILNDLRNSVVESLHQTGKDGEAQDGMDVAVVVIDQSTMKAEYAGAYNSLYLIRDKKLIEYNADKMPIGIHFQKNDDFKNNIIDLQKDDQLYIFSDGYMDQFGGEKGKKFMSKRFKDLLISVSDKPNQEQYSVLLDKFNQWKSETSQIDDVLVIGMKI